jgi:hypothetical protein
MPAHYDYSPKEEALHYIELVRSGKSVEEVRASIAFKRAGDDSDEHYAALRRKTLLYFDLMVARLPSSRTTQKIKLFRERLAHDRVSPALRRWVVARLEDGWSHRRIARQMPALGLHFVQKLSKEIGIRRGFGPRPLPLSAAEKAAILADMRIGMTWRKLVKKYHHHWRRISRALGGKGNEQHTQRTLRSTERCERSHAAAATRL